MPVPINRFKQLLATGQVLHGCWLGMADAYVAEIVSTAGFDWLLIDGEHAPNDIRSILAQLQAIAPSDSAPIVRLVDADPAKIKQALDIGVQNLLLPMIESGEAARQAVAATRYPPEGHRGVGAALARASRFGEITDYVQSANNEICLLLQVESQVGLHALDDILAVDGVDGVFIGPSDLAADLGHPGNAGHSQVRTAVLDALKKIRAADRVAGVLATAPEFAAECRQAGAGFIGVGIDVTLFATAVRTLARTSRESATAGD